MLWWWYDIDIDTCMMICYDWLYVDDDVEDSSHLLGTEGAPVTEWEAVHTCPGYRTHRLDLHQETCVSWPDSAKDVQRQY